MKPSLATGDRLGLLRRRYGAGNPLLIEGAACLGLAVGLLVHPARSALPDGHWLIQHVGFWASNGLNTLADKGDLTKITQRINGGQNGAADRQALYAKALKVLG